MTVKGCRSAVALARLAQVFRFDLFTLALPLWWIAHADRPPQSTRCGILIGMSFVSRAGQKLEHALITFGLDVSGRVCADLGSNVGGFVDCLLQHGAAKVYAIDTGYGVLEWKLRKDPRVVVMERTNAMHVELPELVSLVTIDVAWTRQRLILPAGRRILAPGGDVVTLIKPHYEAEPTLLRKGVLPAEHVEGVVESVKRDIEHTRFTLVQTVQSPIKGAGGNIELLAWLKAPA